MTAAPAARAATGEGLVEVAVLTAVPGRYHYKVPPHLAARVHVGSRVLVRFGGKKLTGIVVRAGTPPPADVVPIAISEVLDHDEPALTPELVDLCMWMADYYEAPPGEAVKGALPAGSNISARAMWVLTEAGRAAADGKGGALPAKQRMMIAKLAQDDLPTTGASAATRAVIEALIQAGLVELHDLKSQRTRLPREKVVRIVGDLDAAYAQARRAPKRRAVIEALAAAFGRTVGEDASAGVDGASVDGASVDGASVDGASVDGASVESVGVEGVGVEGVGVDGVGVDGVGVDGVGVEGVGVEGVGVDGVGVEGVGVDTVTGDVVRASADGANDGDAQDVGANRGDANDGDANDGDTNDGDANDSDANDGDANDGDTNDGDANDGDANDGDVAEVLNDGDADPDAPAVDIVRLEVLERRIPHSRPVLRELAKQGLLEITEREAELEAIAIGAAMHAGPPPTLTDEQAHAVGEITAALRSGTFRPFLLFGVTGSGKTEVYLRVIADALAAGKTALVLVPEISLTPQLAARFRARFGDQVAILHSGLGEQARLGEWSRLRRGEAKIAVGARSAVFAPLERVGVIVVDEEHDGSFKQDEGVKYHARDVALVRAQRAGAVCVLGSGTPSLESNWLAEKGTYGKLVLTQRPMARPMPAVEVVDLRMYQPDGEAFLSAPLRTAIGETLAAGDQIILFLNRRGFATFVLCTACGHAFRCPNCSVSLTYHRSLDRAACHYCSYTERIPEACPKCQARAIERKGLGTEKIAAAVAEAFPEARVARLDRDVASGSRVEAVLSRVARREVDILVGTQMVTKGHDFPGVTLVGVLCADTGLNLPDFRASERTFQLLSQVAGRAGRGDRPGRVLIQTYRPGAPAVTAAAAHDYARFYAAEVAERAERSYPPHGRLIVIRVDGADEHQVADTAQRIAQASEYVARRLAEAAEQGAAAGASSGGASASGAAPSGASASGAAPTGVSPGGTGTAASGPPSAAIGLLDVVRGVEVLGPTPAPLSRLRGRSRWQIWLRGADRAALRRVARQAVTVEHPSTIRVTLDVDPNSAL